MSDSARKKLRDQVRAVDEEIQKMEIAVDHPTSNKQFQRMKDKTPVASLAIPNKLYLLLDKRLRLQE